MSNIKILYICFILFFSNIIAQEHLLQILPDRHDQIVHYINESTGEDHYTGTVWNYGYLRTYVPETDPPLYIHENYHTVYKFDLTDLPQNAYNISATLEAWRVSGTGSSMIVSVPDNLNFNNMEESWNAADTGNEYFTVSQTPGVTNDVTNIIVQRISQGYINFGARQTTSVSGERGDISIILKIYFDLPINLTAKNNFELGTIKVGVDTSPVEKNSPHPFSPDIGQTVNLEAQHQSYGGYERVWNDYTPNNLSRWSKNGVPGSYLIAYSFQVVQNDDNAIYEAGLRRNFEVDQTHKTEFDGDYTDQATEFIVEGNSEDVSAPSAITPNTITYNFAGWLDDLSESRTRTFTPDDNEEYDVLYKYPNHSNSTSAYSSNSQKKLVRTVDGNLHKVYFSMGYVWYEKSTDNGATWTIENNGKPLSSNEAKLPAIDYNSASEIIIVWQEKYDYYGLDIYKIMLAHYQRPGTQLIFYDVYDASVWPDPTPYSYDAMPVIAWANNKILVVWKDYELFYRYGYADFYGPTTWYTSEYGTWVTGTDGNSINPTIAIRKDGGTTVFHLAWQQGTSAIKYCTLTPDAQDNIDISSSETPSSGSGFNFNISPSISITGSGYPTVVWIGSIYESATTQVTKRSKGSSGWASTFGKYGTNVNSPTEHNSIIVWSENNTNKLYRPWSSIRTLSTVGHFVQLSTGSPKYAVAYRQYSPYDFQISPNVVSLPKVNAAINKCGREGIVAKGEAEFYFTLGDVIVDDEVINFPITEDTTNITNTNELNRYMETNTFSISGSSSFSFSIAYGAVDTLKALNELRGDSRIKFKVELVDDITNEILGELDEIILDKDNIYISKIQSYQVNTERIGNRRVELRVTTSTNFDGAYYLAVIFAEEEVLGKRNLEELNFSGESIITSYDLFQNYPNPFNPSTILKYQIPQNGFVTLKVYDILGKEVATLVNEEKATGRYEINFNASSLASGVYLYRLIVNDYVTVKKMLLLK